MLDLKRFSWGDLEGEHVKWLSGPEVEQEIRTALDPESATRTIHWGRNYIYETLIAGDGGGSRKVVVKQTRNHGWRKRIERKLRGSKATRSWRVAKVLVSKGLATPKPVLLGESTEPEGNSYFVAELLEPAYEVRHFFRRLEGASNAEFFPEIETHEMLARLGRLARRIHDAGIWYRDLSLGNVLAHPKPEGGFDLYLIDFNRAKTGRSLGVWRRSRDICRFPIVKDDHQTAFLGGYWGSAPDRWSLRRLIYSASVHGYLLKHRIKNRLRGSQTKAGGGAGGKHHAHIPAADSGASSRDRAVWDKLSDQPHQHASSWQKLRIRLADAPEHVGDLGAVLRSLPRVWRRFRELKKKLWESSTEISGFGIAMMPNQNHAEEHFQAALDLGVRHVLIRLQPWEDDHRDAELLAERLAGNGIELVFSIPQNRALVRSPERWRKAVDDLAQRFTPYGRHFVIGHAVNRSKWGVWTSSEFFQLYRQASEVLRRYPDVEILGPGVIDFEYQSTLAYLNRRNFSFDAVASLLYVDRRGAPENRQLGLDTVDKVVLLKAICDTARNAAPRSWITEVNWPLWEGPHSPAGRSVSVDEESQANYLVRYYLLTLGTGLVERVYWWRLTARGYGLTVEEPDGTLRLRPAYHAYRTMVQQLEGAVFEGPVYAPEGALMYRFRNLQGETLVGWSVDSPVAVELDRAPDAAVDRDGRAFEVSGARVVLGPAPIYFQYFSGEGTCSTR